MMAVWQVTRLSSVHAMANHTLVLFLRGQVADPAAHKVQNCCILRYALPVQLCHLHGQGSLALRGCISAAPLSG